MLQTAVIIAVLVVLGARYAKAHALEVKAENKAIENTYYALIERKEFAQEAQAQDAETYQLAKKLARK